MEASLDWLLLAVSGTESKLVSWAVVWSDTSKLARLSGKVEMVSTMSSLPRLGRGAMAGLLLLLGCPLGLSAAALTLPAVSRCLVAAEMAAAVKPAVAISIWSVEMIESAVTMGLLE